MQVFKTNIERDTLKNRDFRNVIFTGSHMQVMREILEGLYF